MYHLRKETRDLKEVVVELTLENRLLKKKRHRDWGRPRMRYPATEKLEIIRLVEQSHLPAKRTLGQLGIPSPAYIVMKAAEEYHDKITAPNQMW